MKLQPSERFPLLKGWLEKWSQMDGFLCEKHYWWLIRLTVRLHTPQPPVSPPRPPPPPSHPPSPAPTPDEGWRNVESVSMVTGHLRSAPQCRGILRLFLHKEETQPVWRCAISCWILLSPTQDRMFRRFLDTRFLLCAKRKSKCKSKTLQNTTKKNNCRREMLQFPETKSKSASTLGGTGPETSVLWGKSLCKDISQHTLKKFSFLLRGGTKMYF